MKPVLVVDDPSGTLAALAGVLTASGYAVTRLLQEEAIDAFEMHEPEIVLVQLYQGGGSGVTLTEQIRQRPDGAIVPVIFFGTGNEMVTSVSDALAVGGDYYFQHPIESAKVTAKIRAYIGVGEPEETEEEMTVPLTLPTPQPMLVPGFVSVNRTQALEELDFFSDAAPATSASKPITDVGTEDEDTKQEAEAEVRLSEGLGEATPSEFGNANRDLEDEALADAGFRASGKHNAAKYKAMDAALREIEEEARRDREEEARRAEAQAEAEAHREIETRRRHEQEQKRREEEAHAAAERELEALRAQYAREQEEAARAAAEAEIRAEAERKRAEAVTREAAIRREIEARVQREFEEAAKKAAEQKRFEAEEAQKRELEARIRQEAAARREAKAKADAEEARTEALKKRVQAETRARIEAEMRAEAAIRAEAERIAAERDSGNAPAQASKVEVPRRAAESSEVAPHRPARSDGSIDDIATLLASFVKDGVTGKIRFTRGGVDKLVGFDAGRPVEIVSSEAQDRLEEFLLREHLLTRPQYQSARLKQMSNPRQLGAHVVAEGFLKPQELFDVIRRHFEDSFHALFDWQEGSYSFVPVSVLPEDRIVLPERPERLVAEGIKRRYQLPRLLKRVGGPSSLLIAKPSDRAYDFGFDPRERQLQTLLDGTHSIEDLVFSLGLGEERVYQVLFSLVAFDAAEVAVRGSASQARPDAHSLAIDRARIREKSDQAKNSDYFKFLGLDKNATEYEVERTVAAVRRAFSADRFPPDILRELGAELKEIDRVLADAEYVLKDARLRDAYLRHMEHTRLVVGSALSR